MGKILVVDDEDDVRLSLERRMKRDGHSIQTAASQAEAVELISSAEVPFDVVLTDMLMESPNSGVEVLKATLARDVFTEVVILTAYGNVANAVECMKMGAFDYVEKNIPGVDVYELISIKTEQALDRRRSSLSTVRKLEHFAKVQDKHKDEQIRNQ
jgi:DNA-binding NtrC family response regulator